MVVTCRLCTQKVPLLVDSFEMASHGIFEVGPGEENIICPASHTSNFVMDLDEHKLMSGNDEVGA